MKQIGPYTANTTQTAPIRAFFNFIPWDFQRDGDYFSKRTPEQIRLDLLKLFDSKKGIWADKSRTVYASILRDFIQNRGQSYYEDKELEFSGRFWKRAIGPKITGLIKERDVLDLDEGSPNLKVVLAGNLGNTPFMMRAAILLENQSGMRNIEMASILWSDINWQYHLLHIRAETTKCSYERWVYLFPETYEALKEWQKHYDDYIASKSKGRFAPKNLEASKGRVFPITTNNLNLKFKNALRNSVPTGIRGDQNDFNNFSRYKLDRWGKRQYAITFYSFRNSFKARSQKAGMDLTLRNLIMGHGVEDPMSQVYIRGRSLRQLILEEMPKYESYFSTVGTVPQEKVKRLEAELAEARKLLGEMNNASHNLISNIGHIGDQMLRDHNGFIPADEITRRPDGANSLIGRSTGREIN